MEMVFTTEEFLDVAIEYWSEWDLNPLPLNYMCFIYALENMEGY